MEIHAIKDWANNNSGFLAFIAVLISLVTFFLKWIFGKFNNSKVNKKFIQKSGKNSQNIQGENITLNNYDNDK